MILNGVYYARPSDNVITDAVVASAGGGVNANFPLANLFDRNPAKVFKATSTGAILTFTFGAPQTLEAFSLHVHNLVGATVALTNNAGLNQAITIPANDLMGLSVDPFKDLRALANTSATVWTLTITGAGANVAIGEICLIETLRELDVLIGDAERVNIIPDQRNETVHRKRLKVVLGVKLHRLRGSILLDSLRPDLIALFDDAQGHGHGFLVIPDLDTNECYFMECEAEEFAWVYQVQTITPMKIGFIEVGRGPGVA